MKKIFKNLVTLFMVMFVLFAFAGCMASIVKDNGKNHVKSKEMEQEENKEEFIRYTEQNETVEIDLTQQTETDNQKFEQSNVEQNQVEQEEKKEEEYLPKDSFATITSFGDTLCHMGVVNAAYNKEDDVYDFSPMFKYVEKYFQNSTVCIGNLESPFAGKERGYSGYPTFNAPEHLATDLKELNVDIMTTANNHTLDKGFSGLESTLNFLDEAEIAHVGTSRTVEEQNTILFKDLNGIKTAFLAYTYGTNGIPVPSDKEFCVNLIDKDLILKQIQQAKDEGAELIVCSMHWGVEYQTTENAEQDKLAEFLIENDVKVILGCHPHVLQPMKMVKVVTDEGKEKEGLVIFSQGNFFSNQRDINTRNTAIFNVEVKKNGETNEVTVQKATYVPIYVSIKEPGAKDRYELLDLNEIIRSYEAGENLWSENNYKLALTERERCISLIGP